MSEAVIWVADGRVFTLEVIWDGIEAEGQGQNEVCGSERYGLDCQGSEGPNVLRRGG